MVKWGRIVAGLISNRERLQWLSFFESPLPGVSWRSLGESALCIISRSSRLSHSPHPLLRALWRCLSLLQLQVRIRENLSPCHPWFQVSNTPSLGWDCLWLLIVVVEAMGDWYCSQSKSLMATEAAGGNDVLQPMVGEHCPAADCLLLIITQDPLHLQWLRGPCKKIAHLVYSPSFPFLGFKVSWLGEYKWQTIAQI